MVKYYEPSDQDYEQAGEQFQTLLGRFAERHFKIGRCALVDANTLQSRPGYQDASAIYGVWFGPRGKCATMEETLIRLSMANRPDLCRNKRVQDDPQSEEKEHVVYVVFW